MLWLFFFFKQKTAYEIYQCDWSSDVCSSDLHTGRPLDHFARRNPVDYTDRELFNATHRLCTELRGKSCELRGTSFAAAGGTVTT